MTNTRGRILEILLVSKQLYIMNEESVDTIIRNSRGASNVDLTIISNQLLITVVEWEISEQESYSDHSIIKYAIGQGARHRPRCAVYSEKREVCKFPGKPHSINEDETLQVK
jgi:hypothetical protein